MNATREDLSGAVSRVDMHCHSSASPESRLGVQRSVGLPECATPPEEVYELAKRRGMDFVTITDHDTIAGVVQIADRPDVFISEELTAHFRGEQQAVHVLCYGISAADHEWLQEHRRDVEMCAAYMYECDILCALAHPYYTVAAPLTARHRRRLAQLFDVWETRNGARPRELNRPAATYIAALGRAGIGGSDDHAGVDIGRTWTETAPARTPQEFLAAVRAGRAVARGSHGSPAKWAHAAIALAARVLGGGTREVPPRPPDPALVLRMVQRLLSEADARQGPGAADLQPADARCLLRSWLVAVELDDLDEQSLIAYMQEERFSHADLFRRACRVHERDLRRAVEQAAGAVRAKSPLAPAAVGVFNSCMAAIPYAPATAFLASEQARLDTQRDDGEHPRVAIVADGIGATHGVSRVVQEIRRRGVQGFEIEVLGTDPEVDRRLSSVAELEMPYYPGLRIGVPSLCAATQTLADGAFDVIHVCSPGPVGAAGALISRGLGIPLVGSYHTELAAYARVRSGDPRLADAIAHAVGTFYRACDVVLSPSPAADRALAVLGVAADRVARWDRGVDIARFSPSLREHRSRRDSITVLYAGRISAEKGAGLLAEAFALAHERDPRLQLVLAGGGPEQAQVHTRLGSAATFLGWLEGAELARAYANADVLLFPSATDTFGQVILEAQASGLPVAAVAAGGPASLIEHRVNGLLCRGDARSLADAVLELAGSPQLRRRLAHAALAAAKERTWERALARLGAGYARALRASGKGAAARAA